jgi:gluconolactonase
MSGMSRRAVLAAGVALSVPAGAAPLSGSYGSVRRLSSEIDELIAPDATIDQVAYGYQWSEGPVWVKNGGYLLFNDPPLNTIYKLSKGNVSVLMKPSGLNGTDPTLTEPGTNGLAIDAAGALVMCDCGHRALARVDLATMKKQIIVDRYDGKRFNSPNDLCIARSGAIYFTDPPFSLVGSSDSPAKELAFSGIYRLSPDGKVALLDPSFAFPNGIALSPDESTLYVSNSDPATPLIKAFRLGLDGMPTSSSTFFDMASLKTPGTKGNPNGIKLDEAGNLFAAGPGGVLVLSKEAKLLGLISVTGRAASNCAFGEDGSTLFITATDIVARVKLKTHGAV